MSWPTMRCRARQAPLIFVLLLAGSCMIGDPSADKSAVAPSRPMIIDVPSKIVSDCSKSVSDELNALIASSPDGSTVLFPSNKCYAQDNALFVNDRSGLTIDGRGSTFRATVENLETCRPNWWVQGGTDITLKNIIVYGRNPGGFDDPRVPNGVGQCEHGFVFGSTQGGALLGSAANNVYGDVVGIHPDLRKQDYCAVPPARDILVENFRGVNAGRTVGITSGERITIRDSYIADMYDAAIDLEVDLPCEYVNDIHIVNNRFGRYHFALLNVYTTNLPSDHSGRVEFRGNVYEGPVPSSCFPPIFFTDGGTPEPAPQLRDVTIADNNLKTRSQAVWLDHVTGATITNNLVLKSGLAECANPDVVSGKFYGLVAFNSHDVSFTGNRLVGEPPDPGYDGEVFADSDSTGISPSR